LLRSGFSRSEVAERLRTSIQYVHQTERAAEARLLMALMDVAKASDIQMRGVLPKEGMLWGYNPGIKQEAIVTYTTRYGIKIWYWYDNPEEVNDKGFLEETRDYLIALAEERQLELSDEEKNLHPAKLANLIFSKMIREVRA
jgi:hypothetical protein